MDFAKAPLKGFARAENRVRAPIGTAETSAKQEGHKVVVPSRGISSLDTDDLGFSGLAKLLHHPKESVLDHEQENSSCGVKSKKELKR